MADNFWAFITASIPMWSNHLISCLNHCFCVAFSVTINWLNFIGHVIIKYKKKRKWSHTVTVWKNMKWDLAFCWCYYAKIPCIINLLSFEAKQMHSPYIRRLLKLKKKMLSCNLCITQQNIGKCERHNFSNNFLLFFQWNFFELSTLNAEK